MNPHEIDINRELQAHVRCISVCYAKTMTDRSRNMINRAPRYEAIKCSLFQARALFSRSEIAVGSEWVIIMLFHKTSDCRRL